MKRGFTLIELMIVIAVLVTLMALVVRIGGIGSDSHKRTVTITRMQRLENCLSGFHAAFGCYPPVKLHGNRSLDHQAKNGIDWKDEGKAWPLVEKVCRAQPVGCRFPFSSDMDDMILGLSDFVKSVAQSGEFEGEGEPFESQDMRDWGKEGFVSSSSSVAAGRLRPKKDEVLWSEIKLFQYGLMSYLLPRYLVMMGGNREFFAAADGGRGFAQWTENNQAPSDPFTGNPTTWSELFNNVGEYKAQQMSKGNMVKSEKIVKLELMPSQAVCARWLPNLEGICKCNFPKSDEFKHADEFFGIHIKGTEAGDGGIFDSMGDVESVGGIKETCFSPDDDQPYKDQYLLDEVTVNDGWGHEFYYYSRSPHQSYTLWSSGPDGKTFPPWISRDKLQSNARGDQEDATEAGRAAKWTKDDIIHLSN